MALVKSKRKSRRRSSRNRGGRFFGKERIVPIDDDHDVRINATDLEKTKLSYLKDINESFHHSKYTQNDYDNYKNYLVFKYSK